MNDYRSTFHQSDFFYDKGSLADEGQSFGLARLHARVRLGLCLDDNVVSRCADGGILHSLGAESSDVWRALAYLLARRCWLRHPARQPASGLCYRFSHNSRLTQVVRKRQREIFASLA